MNTDEQVLEIVYRDVKLLEKFVVWRRITLQSSLKDKVSQKRFLKMKNLIEKLLLYSTNQRSTRDLLLLASIRIRSTLERAFPQDNQQQKDKEKPLEAHPEYDDASLPRSSLYLASQPTIQSDPSNPRQRERKKVKGAGNCNSRYREHTHTPPITSCPITLTSITHLREISYPRKTVESISPPPWLPLSTSKSQAFHVLKQAVTLFQPPLSPTQSFPFLLRSYFFPPYRFRSHKFHGKRD